MEAFSLFERACGCGVPSVWWHRKAPCSGVGRFRLEAKGGGVGDGHVASVVSLVTWGDACVARATQRPFPVDVGVTSARCGGGATPNLAFFMRRGPQEHPFGGDLPFWQLLRTCPLDFTVDCPDDLDDESIFAGNIDRTTNAIVRKSRLNSHSAHSLRALGPSHLKIVFLLHVLKFVME